MMMLSEATTAMDGKLMGSDVRFSSVDFDTRRLEKNALFFAIHGESKNGHEFIAKATEEHAVAGVADEPFNNEVSIRHIKVDDTTIALGMLATYWRERFDIPVVGITGSNGKTTVTQLVGRIFSKHIPGIAPQGSFNNHWGVPLTLLKLRKQHQSAVIEMGMNHAGELSYLGGLVKPTIALITNAAEAHLEGLKTLQGVADAKGEIIDSLNGNGVMVLNKDDAFFSEWRVRAGNRKIISFGEHRDADVQIIGTDAKDLSINVMGEVLHFKFSLIGRHNRLNAAAAISIALAAQVPFDAITQGLEEASAAKGRLQVHHTPQYVLIDDAYNANLASMRAAIDVLVEHDGEKMLVLGAMGELGLRSDKIHFQVGQYAKQQGIGCLLILDEQDKPAAAADSAAYQLGFGANAITFNNISDLIKEIERINKKPLIILVKGSRFMQMERVVERLKNAGERSC